MRRLLLATLLLLPALAAASPPTWDQLDPEEGWNSWSERKHAAVGTVQVFQKDIAGMSCFQGITHTDLPPKALLAVASDIESVPGWSSAGVREAKVLSRDGDALEYYQYLDVPGWTMSSDRFWFVRGQPVAFGGGHAFRWKNLVEGGQHHESWKKLKEANPGAVEPPINVGSWYFTPDGAKTRVRYAICTDSGGSLPTSIQNAATSRTLPDTVGDMIAEAQRRAKK